MSLSAPALFLIAMQPYCLLVLLVAVEALLPISGLVAQSPGRRSAQWAPYRPGSVELGGPTQIVSCEPCEPVYSEVISDLDLDAMRAPQPTEFYPAAPLPPSTFVDAHSGNPLILKRPQESLGWELLPSDVIWHSYLAGEREPRLSGIVFQELDSGDALLDVSLGARVSILRYGARVNGQPHGWELQMEGAGMPRLNLSEDWDVDATDFRFGLPVVYGDDFLQWKLAYYHLSSHLGDEFIERTGVPATSRINYARDELVAGVSIFPLPAWRWYAEMGWAFYADEGAEPWEFQFGLEYAQPGNTGPWGTPFVAINGHLRQEVDFGGSLATQAGWLWRGSSGRVLRTGLHYHNGKSNQLEFSDEFEHHIGGGLWYDF